MDRIAKLVCLAVVFLFVFTANFNGILIERVIVKCGVWEHDQAAFLCRSKVSSSTPSMNFTPLMTSANRRNPLSFRHPFSALNPSL